ncbi:hypothetical protein B0J11DRAFT_508314 [Dendryphion nanum]|uniref:Uncharacterized protein n=1 Tax=Dendryphion nanum TaxID=256645 RepID=A0A9P9DKS0_9PLEO|nr:hypothetical protein B0J11DRAFT_508314 [Dendryphion nanum]
MPSQHNPPTQKNHNAKRSTMKPKNPITVISASSPQTDDTRGNALYERLKSELSPLLVLLLHFLWASDADKLCYELKPYRPRNPNSIWTTWYDFWYHTGTPIYTMHPTTYEPSLSRSSRLAVLTRENCVDSCFVLLHALQRLFSTGTHIHSIAWVSSMIRPRLVLLNDNRSQKFHDYFVLTSVCGAKFVFDPTGFQFGFPDFFYTWEEYEERYRDWNFAEEEGECQDDSGQWLVEEYERCGGAEWVRDLESFRNSLEGLEISEFRTYAERAEEWKDLLC